jgi:hypothetical protein
MKPILQPLGSEEVAPAKQRESLSSCNPRGVAVNPALALMA